MKVSQYMTRPVLTIPPGHPFRQAIDQMHGRNINHLPVVDNGRVVGIVAKTDLLLAAANFGSAEVPVSEIVHKEPVCVTETAQLKYAARLLVKHHIGCLPVLNTRKQLVGIITKTDIFKITAGMLRARPDAKKASAKKVQKASTRTVKKSGIKVAKKAGKKTA